MCGRYYRLFDKQQVAEHFHVRRAAENVGVIAPKLPMGNHLTTQEAADWLGMKESTLRDWRSDEVGPPYIEISPRCIRAAMEDLIKWRNERRHVPSVQAAVQDVERRITQRKRN